MACQNVCRICPSLVISTAVAFDPTTNSLDITIPDNGYKNCEKVCIVVAQTIPTSTTINALVNILVGGTRFPLQRCDCVQATACEIRTRTKYSTRVVTNTVSGVFRLLGKVYPRCPDSLEALPITPATTPAVANASVEDYSPIVQTAKTSAKTSSKKEVVINE